MRLIRRVYCCEQVGKRVNNCLKLVNTPLKQVNNRPNFILQSQATFSIESILRLMYRWWSRHFFRSESADTISSVIP